MNWLLIFLLALVIAWFVVHWVQLRVVFNPTYDHIYAPKDYKDLFIDDRLHAWHFIRDPEAKTILHCHGNSYNISHMSHIIRLTERANLNLLVWDYSGYGKSKGSPNPNQVYQDGEKVYTYLNQTVPAHQIIIWGESLGGAVATHIASIFPCSTLVLVSTFSSIDDIMSDTYPGIATGLACFLLRGALNMMPSKEKLALVKSPVLIAHSIEDDLIPYSNAMRLYNTVSHNIKKFVTMKGPHSAPILNRDILHEIFTFCCVDASCCYRMDDIIKDLAQGHHL